MSPPEKTTEHDFAETATPQLNEKPIDLIRALIRCYGFVLYPSRKMDFVEMVKRPLRNMHGNLFRSFRSLDAILVIHCDFSEDFEYAFQLFDQMPKCLMAVWVTITLEYTNIGFDVIALGMFKVKQKGGITLVNFIKMNYGAHIHSLVNSMIPLCFDYVCVLGDYNGLEEAKSTHCNHVTYGKGRLQIVKLMDGRATDISIFMSAHTTEALVHDHLITQRENGSHVEFPFCCVFFAHALGLFFAWVLPISSHSKKPDYYVALFGLVYS